MKQDEVNQWTFCLIKPDALERQIMGEILTRVERTYLRIVEMQMRHKNEEWCKQHYANVSAESFFPKLIEFMTARSILGFVVSGPFAILRMRNLIGATKSWQALPGTIRADYGTYPATFNIIHASESQEAAEREFRLFTNYETDFKITGDQDASNVMPK